MKATLFDARQFPEIRALLRQGQVVVLPTDTIPGFSADADLTSALRKIAALKQRPAQKPFLLLLPDFLSAERLCHFSPLARVVANRFWPGPLTLLLPRKKGMLNHFFPSASELAIRVPGESRLRKFLHYYGRPLVSTSVNTANNPPMVDFEVISSRYRQQDVSVYSLGTARFSDLKDSSSTIVRVESGEVEVVRQGVIPEHEIRNAQQIF